MNDTNIVCACNKVSVSDVKSYLADSSNSGKELDVKLEELEIGTRCSCCTKDQCKKIDTHYTELITD